MQSSGEADKQGASVILNNAFQGCLALPFQEERKKEWKFIMKGFLLNKEQRSHSHHFCSNSSGEKSVSPSCKGDWDMPSLSKDIYFPMSRKKDG